MKHKKLVIGCAVIIAIPLCIAVVGFIVGFCQGVAAHFPSKPAFFGFKLGDVYQCEYDEDKDDSVRSYLDWIKNKYRHYERPYAFGGINMEKNVEAKISKIDAFYGQDMALLLVTRNTKKIIGVVVAARCNANDAQQIADEIKTTVIRKHKNVTVVDRVASWQNMAMSRFVRRPALNCEAISQDPCMLICADDNFEMAVMGVKFKAVPEPIIAVPEPTINEERTTKSDYNPKVPLPLPSVARTAHFCYTDRPCGESVGGWLWKINGFVKWQVTSQTIEEMVEERELRKYQAEQQTVDLNRAYVYVLIFLHDYVKYIDADEVKARFDENLRQAEKQREQEQVRRKNAAAL